MIHRLKWYLITALLVLTAGWREWVVYDSEPAE